MPSNRGSLSNNSKIISPFNAHHDISGAMPEPGAVRKVRDGELDARNGREAGDTEAKPVMSNVADYSQLSGGKMDMRPPSHEKEKDSGPR